MISEEGLEKALQDIEDLKKKVNALTADLLVDYSDLKRQISEFTKSAEGKTAYLTQYVASLRLDEQASIVQTLLHRNKASSVMVEQANSDATKTRAEIFHSEVPLDLVSDFIGRWKDRFTQAGFEFISR